MAKIWRNLRKNKEMLQEAARSRAFIIFDTETTGLKATDEIVEFAAYKCAFHQGKFKPYDVLHLYIKPSFAIPAEATEINGITNDFLQDKPSEKEAFEYIRNFLGEEPILGAYNSGFDIRMLGNMYERCGSTLKVKLEIDLLKIAKDIFCEQKMKDHKLHTIANTYAVDEGIEFHCALDDVKVLTRVINAMIVDLTENGQEDIKRTIKVYKLNYYEGYRGNSRLYAITSSGSLYYDLKMDKWFSAVPDRLNLDTVDMEDVERQVFALARCQDYKELRKNSKRFGPQSKKEESA